MKILELNNNLVKCQQQFFNLDGITLVKVSELDNIEYANTTDNKILELKNLYSINVYDRLTNKNITLRFKCNVKNSNHTYINLSSVTIDYKKTYHAIRFIKKYILLVQDIAYALGVQYKEIN